MAISISSSFTFCALLKIRPRPNCSRARRNSGWNTTGNMAINEVMAAARVMSREHTGALIVFEREVGLNDFVDTGILIDAVLSRELIKNIFVPSTPLHDGALIIRDGRIRAAGCLLPLTEDRTLSM